MTGTAIGAPLDDALDLVSSASVLVQAANKNATEAGKQSDWSARVRLAYQAAATDTEAAGFGGGVYLEIPLFSRKARLAATKARYEAANTEHKIREAFLNDVAKIMNMDAKQAEAEHMKEFHKDRLEYFKQAEREGLIEPDRLWADAEKAQKSHFRALKITTEIKAKIEEIARIYGNRQWKQLQALLVAHLKQTQR